MRNYFDYYTTACETMNEIENKLWKDYSDMNPFMTFKEIKDFMYEKDIDPAIIFKYHNAFANRTLIREYALKNDNELYNRIEKSDCMGNDAYFI